MPKTFEEFFSETKKPKGLKEYVVEGWNRGKEKIRVGIKWVVENPEETAVITTLVTIASGVLKKGLRYVTTRRETYNKERFIYDHSANAYLKTSRPLKNNDVKRINDLRRKNPGMRMSEALERLNLLD